MGEVAFKPNTLSSEECLDTPGEAEVTRMFNEGNSKCLHPAYLAYGLEQTCGRVTLYYEVSRFDTLKLFTFFKF